MLNPIFANGPEKMKNALVARRPYYKCRCSCSVEQLLQQVLDLEPRLICYINNMSVSCKQTPFQVENEYEFSFVYNEDVPEISQIMVDDGTWTIDKTQKFFEDVPSKMYVVTQDENSVRQRIDEDTSIAEHYPGLVCICTYDYCIDMCPKYKMITVEAEMCVENNEYVRLQSAAKQRANDIIKNKLGGNILDISKPLKAFLAYSYLQQNVSYDYEESKSKSIRETDPAVIMPYGPLLERRGICAGISSAYKMFMDLYDIPCRIVTGMLKTEHSYERHAWNMIQLGSSWFHVDPTANISEDKFVYAGGFLRTDKGISRDYSWETNKWPRCSSTLWNFDRVAEMIAEHNQDYKHIDYRYLHPDIIE